MLLFSSEFVNKYRGLSDAIDGLYRVRDGSWKAGERHCRAAEQVLFFAFGQAERLDMTLCILRKERAVWGVTAE